MPDVFSNILQKEQISWCGFIMQTFSLIRQRNPSSFFYFLVLIAEAKTQSACHTFEFKNIPHNTYVVWQPTTSPHIKKQNLMQKPRSQFTLFFIFLLTFFNTFSSACSLKKNMMTNSNY